MSDTPHRSSAVTVTIDTIDEGPDPAEPVAWTGVVVMSGPPACRKDQHAEQIADLLGCSVVVPDWDGRGPLPDRALALTDQEWPKPRPARRLADDEA